MTQASWWETSQVIGAFVAVVNFLILISLYALVTGIARRERHYLEIIKQYANLAGRRADESSDKLEEVGKDVKETARKVDDLAEVARPVPRPTNSTAHA
jgi:hypothetical protein